MLSNKWNKSLEDTPKEIIEYLLVRYMNFPLEYIRNYMLNKDYVLFGKLTLCKFLADGAASGISYGDPNPTGSGAGGGSSKNYIPIKDYIPTAAELEEDEKIARQAGVKREKEKEKEKEKEVNVDESKGRKPPVIVEEPHTEKISIVTWKKK